MKPGVEGTLPLVSVFPAPVLRWVLVPPPDPAVVDRPRAVARHSRRARRAAGAARPGHRGGRADVPPPRRHRAVGSRRARRHERGGRGHRRRRAGRRHHPGPRRLRRRRPVRHGAAHPRTPGGRARTSWGSCRTGCATGTTSGPPASPRRSALGASLVVTCDCGITAVDTVRAARAAGIGVVVTDHHLPGAELPPALAVVDPQRADDTSGARGLCGTGIAFKLVQALVPALGLPPNLPYHLLDLVALATVADVVPLVGENRILVRHGLKLLAESRWPGLRALVAASGPRRGRSSAPATWATSWARGSTRPGGSGMRPRGSGSCSPTIRTKPPSWRGGWRGSTSSASRSTSGCWRKRSRRWSRRAIPSGTPASCSRGRAGTRAWWGSWRRASSSATGGRRF